LAAHVFLSGLGGKRLPFWARRSTSAVPEPDFRLVRMPSFRRTINPVIRNGGQESQTTGFEISEIPIFTLWI
jgi:hypothetical protein